MKTYLRLYAILVLVGVLLGFAISNFEESKSNINYNVTNFKSYSTSMIVPAVDSLGNGTTVNLNVELKPGNGRILTNIDKLVFWLDTQESMQLARNIAENITGIDTSNLDIIYALDGSKIAVAGGPSAGAALTISTISALEQRQIKPNISITGTIQKNGSIGKVGGVLEKALAAKKAGIITFLVPIGESYTDKIVLTESCSNKDGKEFCEKKYENKTIDIAKEANISVVEIGTISEAAELMLE